MSSPMTYQPVATPAEPALLDAPENIVVTVQPDPDSQNWDATFDPVEGAESYEYLIDNEGAWTSVAGSPISNSNLAGFHLLLVRGVNSLGTPGNLGVSNRFELVEA